MRILIFYLQIPDVACVFALGAPRDSSWHDRLTIQLTRYPIFFVRFRLSPLCFCSVRQLGVDNSRRGGDDERGAGRGGARG